MTETTNTVEGADLAPETPEPVRDDPWAGFNDHGKCDGCGKTKDRIIRRQLGAKSDKRRLCDECHEEKR